MLGTGLEVLSDIGQLWCGAFGVFCTEFKDSEPLWVICRQLYRFRRLQLSLVVRNKVIRVLDDDVRVRSSYYESVSVIAYK